MGTVLYIKGCLNVFFKILSKLIKKWGGVLILNCIFCKFALFKITHFYVNIKI